MAPLPAEPEPDFEDEEPAFDSAGGHEPPAHRDRAPTWVRPTIAWTALLISTVIFSLVLLDTVKVVVVYLLLALFFSFALEPAVNSFQRRRGWRRGPTTVVDHRLAGRPGRSHLRVDEPTD